LFKVQVIDEDSPGQSIRAEARKKIEPCPNKDWTVMLSGRGHKNMGRLMQNIEDIDDVSKTTSHGLHVATMDGVCWLWSRGLPASRPTATAWSSGLACHLTGKRSRYAWYIVVYASSCNSKARK
jgi:hypothetical protein